MTKRRKRILAILWAVAICLSLCAAYLTFINCGYTKVCFLDVGQGDSCYIKTDRGSTVLIDGGDDGSGHYVLEPFLRQEFARNLDAVFISHMHDDHIAGIIELLENDYIINIIYISDKASRGSGYSQLKTLAERQGVPITPLSSGDEICIDSVKFLVVSSGYTGTGKVNENDNSLILRMDCGENSILFTGDATRRYETEILGNDALDTDFLKVGHHGSYTSSGREFLEQISPQISIISVGADNSYNHPSMQTLQTISEMKLPMVRTDYDGTISIIMTKDDVKRITYSRERR